MIKRQLPDGVFAKILDVPYLPIVLIEGQSGLPLVYKIGNSWYDEGKKVFLLREDSELHYLYEESINLGGGI